MAGPTVEGGDLELREQPRAGIGRVRAVGWLDVFLGLQSVQLAAAYFLLYSRNFRLTLSGRTPGIQGAFFALAVNARWCAEALGMGEIPGGPHRDLPGSPTYGVLYLITPGAPRVGLVAVAASGLVPWTMILEGRAARERAGAKVDRRRPVDQIPGSLTTLCLAQVLSVAIHLVAAWWSLLAIKVLL